MKKIKMKKATFLALLSSLLVWLSMASMNYPIHMGGFAGDTDLQDFAFDRYMNLVVTGVSTDT